jgi:hypothetical protein
MNAETMFVTTTLSYFFGMWFTHEGKEESLFNGKANENDEQTIKIHIRNGAFN